MMNNLDFEFHIDIESYFVFFSQYFTLKGLSKLTNVNERQLSHYLNGYKKARPETARKIEEGLLNFAETIEGIRLT